VAREINAITFLVTDMARTLAFYESLGLDLVTVYGGPDQAFTSLRYGENFVNLSAGEGPPAGHWGRVILHVDDVDAVHAAAVAAGHQPEMAPSDAPWGERYFHLRDPDGHELSFAKLL